MAHLHASLSGQGIDDADFPQVESLPTQNSQDTCLSGGSFGDRSSPVHQDGQSENWHLEEQSIAPDRSSVRGHFDALPETIPASMPTQKLRNHRYSIVKPAELDCSETCSTNRRSSPFNMHDVGDEWQLDDGESEAQQLSPSIESDDEPAQKSNADPKPKAQTPNAYPKTGGKVYNTRPRRHVSYADGTSDVGDDGQAAQAPPKAAGKQPPKWKASPPKTYGAATKKSQPKSKAAQKKSPPQKTVSPSGAKKKRKQRAKTPLPFDDETQTIRPNPPATPPVSVKRSTKRQKIARRPPRLLSPELEINDEAERPTSSELASPPQPNMADTEVMREPLQKTLEPQAMAQSDLPDPVDVQHDSPLGDLYMSPQDRATETRGNSILSDSTNITSITSPSVSEIRKPIAAIPVRQPASNHISPPSSIPLAEGVGNSMEYGMPRQHLPLRELSLIMSNTVAKRCSDMQDKLQEINGVSGATSYLEVF